jgi:hypothetical protein
VVMVAVVTRERVAIASGVRDIWENRLRGGEFDRRILRGAAIPSRA